MAELHLLLGINDHAMSQFEMQINCCCVLGSNAPGQNLVQKLQVLTILHNGSKIVISQQGVRRTLSSLITAQT